MLVQSGGGLKVEEKEKRKRTPSSIIPAWMNGGKKMPLTEVRYPRGDQRKVWGKGGLVGHLAGSVG